MSRTRGSSNLAREAGLRGGGGRERERERVSVSEHCADSTQGRARVRHVRRHCAPTMSADELDVPGSLQTWRGRQCCGGQRGKERKMVSVSEHCADSTQGRAHVRHVRRHCAPTMSASNVTYKGVFKPGAPAWRTEAQGRAERSGRR